MAIVQIASAFSSYEGTDLRCGHRMAQRTIHALPVIVGDHVAAICVTSGSNVTLQPAEE